MAIGLPLIVGSLVGGLIQAAGTLVGRVLVSLGIGYAAYSGIDTSITFARDYLLGKLGAMPAQAMAVASTMQIGVCISILTSAVLARMVLKGLTGGTLKRFTVS